MPRRFASLLVVMLAVACGDEGPGARGPKRQMPAPADPAAPRQPAARRGGEDAPARGDTAPEPTRVVAEPSGDLVTCPVDTLHQGSAPPHGTRSFCLRRTDEGGVQHGPYREWSPEGYKLADGNYDEGQRDGTWTEYFPDGTPRARTTFEDGVREGPWKTWYEDGQLSGEGSYRQGRKEGLATFWYPDGTKQAEGNWGNDLKQGRSTNYHPDGSLASQGDYVDGNKHGTWVDVDADGTRRETTWRDGVQVDD